MPQREKPIKRKLFVTQAISVGSLFAITLISTLALLSLPILRSYVGSEGDWSRARHKATVSLERYINTGERKNFEEYTSYIQIPTLYRNILEEIDKDESDFYKIRDWLTHSGSYHGETMRMGVFFKLTKSFPYIREAIEEWRLALVALENLIQYANKVDNSFAKGVVTPAARRVLIDELNQINVKIEIIERRFSRIISAASRELSQISIYIVFIIGLAMIIITWHKSNNTYLHIVHGLESLNRSAHLYSEGDFAHRTTYPYNDEIGMLAKTIYNMSEQLEQMFGDLTNLMDAITSAAIVSRTDIDGVITYVNKSFIEISGYDESELIGQNHKILRSGVQSEAYYLKIWAEISSGRIWRGELCNKRKDGSLYWVITTISPVFKKNQLVGYIGIVFDLTKEKEAQAKLLHASRLSSLGEMAGGIAHEINTPLAAVQLFTERLREIGLSGQVDKIDWQRDTDRILSAVKRITDVVVTMRRLAGNAKPIPMRNNNCADIIWDAVNLCGEKFKNNGVEIRVNIIDNCEIYCRPSEISQVLLNMFSNSFRAIHELEEKWVLVESQVISNIARISVTDSGHGIAPYLVEKMMNPFVSEGGSGENMGVGLSISRQIIHEHQGHMYYDNSCLNTRFILELKLADEVTPIG